MLTWGDTVDELLELMSSLMTAEEGLRLGKENGNEGRERGQPALYSYSSHGYKKAGGGGLR